MGVEVDGDRSLRVRGVDQTEDRALALVDPVAQVVHVVVALLARSAWCALATSSMLTDPARGGGP